MNATTVAVDLAKSVFQLAVADASWRIIETQVPDLVHAAGCLECAPHDDAPGVVEFDGKPLCRGLCLQHGLRG